MVKQFYLIVILIIFLGCKKNIEKAHADINIPVVLGEEYYANIEKSRVRGGGHLSVSEDNKFIIESGMYPDGGTSPDYWAVFKFLNRKGDTCIVDMKYSPYMSNIHVIRKNDGNTYYIVECMSKSSSSQASEWLTAYKIVNDTIKHVSVIDGSENFDQDCYRVDYCIPNWYFATNGAGYDWMFEYEPKTCRLFIPLTDEHNYDITDHYYVWQFNGERFVNKGKQPHKDLHSSLSEYKCLISYFTTKDYSVRVDSLDNKQLRYASWKKPKMMSDAPDIILIGGIRRKFSAAPDEYKRNDEFSFLAKNVEYIVGHNEIIPNEDGFGANSYEYLLVKRNEKIILKQAKVNDE